MSKAADGAVLEDYSTTFANLMSVPRDVLALVFSHLCEHRDLASLSRVCSRFQGVVREADLLSTAVNPPARRHVHREALRDEVKHRLSMWDSAVKTSVVSGAKRAYAEVKALHEGERGSGCTALVNQLCHGVYVEDYQPCCAGDSWRKILVIDGVPNILLDVWIEDSRGEYPLLTEHLRRDADVHLVTYSVTSRSSFEDARKNGLQIRELKPNFAPIILVGNKCDIEESRVVSEQEGRLLAQQLEAGFIETSAKFAVNVTALYADACRLGFASRIRDPGMRPKCQIY